MRLQKIADTNLRANLKRYYSRRLASLAGKLQKVLNELSMELAAYPGMPWVEQQATGVDNFLVTPFQDAPPGKDIVTVTNNDFSVDVDPGVALEMLQSVQPYDAEGNRISQLTIELILGEAETQSGLSDEWKGADPEAVKGTPWEYDRFALKSPRK